MAAITPKNELEEKVLAVLKTIYDPEIPVNLYDLGLIYLIRTDEENNVVVVMTLTAPGCPIADSILEEVRTKIKAIEGVNKVEVELTFYPPWTKDMMSEEAMLDLGFM